MEMNPALMPVGRTTQQGQTSPLRLRAVTFDVYSALFDTLSGLRDALQRLFRIRGIAADPTLTARTWRQRHMEYLLVANSLQQEVARNLTALEASVRQTLRALTPPLSADELTDLIRAWETLPPWPEAGAVLTEVRRRPDVLGALSNGDTDMLTALLTRVPVPFDHIVSTEGRRFKPDPSVYAHALAVLGVGKDELLHVAGSASDAAGATAFGIRTVWVNRAGDAVADPRYAPAHEVPDLHGVLEVLNRH
jgi:2-haloacid dehalogenase